MLRLKSQAKTSSIWCDLKTKSKSCSALLEVPATFKKTPNQKRFLSLLTQVLRRCKPWGLNERLSSLLSPEKPRLTSSLIWKHTVMMDRLSLSMVRIMILNPLPFTHNGLRPTASLAVQAARGKSICALRLLNIFVIMQRLWWQRRLLRRESICSSARLSLITTYPGIRSASNSALDVVIVMGSTTTLSLSIFSTSATKPTGAFWSCSPKNSNCSTVSLAHRTKCWGPSSLALILRLVFLKFIRNAALQRKSMPHFARCSVSWTSRSSHA